MTLSDIHPPNTQPPQLWKRAGDIRAHLKRQSGPTTSWQIDGETVETVSDFIFLGSKLTADGEYRCEIKDT